MWDKTQEQILSRTLGNWQLVVPIIRHAGRYRHLNRQRRAVHDIFRTKLEREVINIFEISGGFSFS